MIIERPGGFAGPRPPIRGVRRRDDLRTPDVGWELVERARAGDGAAFDELAARSIDRLYAVARRILGGQERAEDAVQEALLLAWRDLPQLREPEAWEGWLMRLLVRSCYREARRARAHATVALAAEHDRAAGDDPTTIAQRDEIDRAFRRLSVDHRAVLVMTHYLGLTGPQIALALDVAPGTVKSRLHHATRALRAVLEADARSRDARR